MPFEQSLQNEKGKEAECLYIHAAFVLRMRFNVLTTLSKCFSFFFWPSKQCAVKKMSYFLVFNDTPGKMNGALHFTSVRDH